MKSSPRKARVAVMVVMLVGAALLIAPVADAGLVSHWAFDDGSGQTAADSTFTHDGTLGSTGGSDANDPTWTTSAKVGDSALSYASNDYVNMNAAVIPTTGNFTAVGWVKTAVTHHDGALIGQGHTGNDRLIYYGTRSSNEDKARVYLGGSQLVISTTKTNDQQWHHVAFTRSGNNFELYVDGVSEATNTRTVTVSGENTYVGRADNGTTYGFQGTIDDVAIWSNTLSATEIKAVWSLADTADVNHNANQAQQLFNLFEAGSASTSVGPRAWKNASGLSGSAGDVQDLGGGDYAVVLDGTGNGVQSWTGLIAHYKFDDGTGQTAADSAGGNHGTLGTSSGSDGRDPAWATGKIGGALSFAGNDLVDGGSDNAVTNLSGAKTFAFWTYTIEGGSNGYLGLTTPRPPNSLNRWYVDDCNSEGRIRMLRRNDPIGVNQGVQTPAGTLEYGKWQHVALVDNGTSWEVYVNGVSAGALGNSFDLSSLPNTSVLTIGRVPFSGSYQYLNGLMDDVGAWNVALSAGEAMALFSLADDAILNYDLGLAQDLFELHAAGGSDALTIGSCVWRYAEDLTTDLGVVTTPDGLHFSLKLDQGGTGLVGVIPEPATLTLLALGGLGLLIRRRRRRC